MTTRATIGNNIYRHRVCLRLTQEQLAKRVKRDRTAISKIERGRQSLAAEDLFQWAEALSTSVAALLNG